MKVFQANVILGDSSQKSKKSLENHFFKQQGSFIALVTFFLEYIFLVTFE